MQASIGAVKSLVDLATRQVLNQLCEARPTADPPSLGPLCRSLPLELGISVWSRALTRGLLGSGASLSRLLPLAPGQLRQVGLAGAVALTDQSLLWVLSECTLLESINVTGCTRLTNESLRALVTRGGHLATVVAADCVCFDDIALPPLDNVEPNLSLKTISLAGLKRLTDSSLLALAKICPALSNVTIDQWDVTSDGLVAAVATWGAAISALSVADCRRLDSHLLVALTLHCPQIATLNLNGCYLIKDEALARLCEVCVGLESVDVSHCNQLSHCTVEALGTLEGLRSVGLSWAATESLAALADSSAAPHLLSLSIAWTSSLLARELQRTLPSVPPRASEIFRRPHQPSPRPLALRSFISLTYLNLGWSGLDDAGLAMVLGSSGGLRGLDLSGCTKLSPDAFLLFKARPYFPFTSLNLSWSRGLTDESLVHILEASCNLTHLDLAICSEITDIGVRACGKLTALRRLVLSRCSQISDMGLDWVEEEAGRTLEALHLADVGLSDFKIANIARFCPKLHTISVSGCRQLTNLALEALAVESANLRSVHMSGCLLIQDPAVKKLAERVNMGLVAVNLAETGLTDDSVLALALHCLSLQVLNISFNNDITDASLYAIVRSLKALRSLEVSHCPNFSDLPLATAISDLPVLTTINLSNNAHASRLFLSAVLSRTEPAVALEELNLTRCYGLEDYMVHSIRLKHPHLTIRE